MHGMSWWLNTYTNKRSNMKSAYEIFLENQKKEDEVKETAVLVAAVLISIPIILAAKFVRFGIKVLDRTVIAILHFL